MDILYWILTIFIILIIVIILCVIFIPNNNNKNKNLITEFFEKDSEILYDTIIHFSAINQNIESILYNLSINYDFISLTDLNNISDIYNYYSNINDKSGLIVSYNNFTKAADNTINTTDNFYLSDNNILQEYTELKHVNNYNGVSLAHSIPLDNLIYLNGNGITCYLRKFKRLVDKKNYIFVQIKLDFNSDKSITYKNLASLLQYIINNYSDDFIITGNFNVQGHEFVFKKFFDEDKYFICPMYKTITANNQTNGLVAFDGLIVSKNLYKSIDYQINFSNTDSGTFILTAKLFLSTGSGMNDTSDYKIQNYISQLNNINKTKNYINNTGTYDSSVITPDTTLIHLVEINTVTSGNYNILSNSKLNKKLNTIETF